MKEEKEKTQDHPNQGSQIRLNEIYREIEQLNPEILPELNKIIKLQSQSQMIIGFLDADALFRHGKLYAERKRVYAETILNSTGTVAEKEAKAELATAEIRLQEEKAKSESKKWSNLFKSTENLIIALRRDERTAFEELQKVNDLYER